MEYLPKVENRHTFLGAQIIINFKLREAGPYIMERYKSCFSFDIQDKAD